LNLRRKKKMCEKYDATMLAKKFERVIRKRKNKIRKKLEKMVPLRPYTFMSCILSTLCDLR